MHVPRWPATPHDHSPPRKPATPPAPCPAPLPTQAPRLEVIEIRSGIEGASTGEEVAGAAMAVALSRPRPVDASGQPVGTLTVEFMDMVGPYVSEEAVEVANHALAFMGRGEWAMVQY